MAVPKKRTSKQRKRKRRTHYKADAVSVSACPKCGDPRRPHHIRHIELAAPVPFGQDLRQSAIDRLEELRRLTRIRRVTAISAHRQCKRLQPRRRLTAATN